MTVPELLFAVEKDTEKRQQADVTEVMTVDTVPRFETHSTPEIHAALAYIRSSGGTIRSPAVRLPLIKAKWEQCRAEKGNRRQMKIEVRQAYLHQRAALRRARERSVEAVKGGQTPAAHPASS